MPRIIKKRIAKKNTRKSKKTNHGFFIVRVLSLCLLLGIGVFYLLQIGKGATAGYAVNDLKKTIAELENQKQLLEIETVKLRSMSNIDERLNDLKMTAVDKLEYLEGEKAVAKK